MDSDDTVEVFVLKAPVWEFKFGDLLGKFVSAFFKDEVLHCHRRMGVLSLVPRPHPSLREGEGLVKNGNIPGPEAGIWESQSDRSICN